MRRIGISLALLLAPVLADEVARKDGKTVRGTVIQRGPKSLLLLTPKGVEVRIARADVTSVVIDPDAPKAGEWVRFKKKRKFGGSLQVALAHLRSPDGARRVDLLSAVHIADSSFWDGIRPWLDHADVVLFEFVKPKGISVPELLKRKRKSKDSVSSFQRKLARWFDLQFQLEAIRYDRPNFVHADLEFGHLPRKGEKGRLPKQLRGLELMLEGVRPQLDRVMGDDRDPKALKLRRQYKNVSARMLATLGNHAAVLFGPALGNALIAQRNKIVIDKLNALPRSHKNVTIFFGAAHMADIEERLLYLGYRREGGSWMTAWDIPD